jgi:hypothetical protein
VLFKKILISASGLFLLTGGLAALATSASARVVCNRAGDCWSTHATVRYPRDLGVHYYNDRYADRAYRDHRWHAYHRTWHDENHDHDRGAYRNGVWVQF